MQLAKGDAGVHLSGPAIIAENLLHYPVSQRMCVGGGPLQENLFGHTRGNDNVVISACDIETENTVLGRSTGF